MSWLEDLTNAVERVSNVYVNVKQADAGVNEGVTSKNPEAAQEPVEDIMTTGDDNMYTPQNALLVLLAIVLIVVLILMKRR